MGPMFPLSLQQRTLPGRQASVIGSARSRQSARQGRSARPLRGLHTPRADHVRAGRRQILPLCGRRRSRPKWQDRAPTTSTARSARLCACRSPRSTRPGRWAARGGVGRCGARCAGGAPGAVLGHAPQGRCPRSRDLRGASRCRPARHLGRSARATDRRHLRTEPGGGLPWMTSIENWRIFAESLTTLRLAEAERSTLARSLAWSTTGPPERKRSSIAQSSSGHRCGLSCCAARTGRQVRRVPRPQLRAPSQRRTPGRDPARCSPWGREPYRRRRWVAWARKRCGPSGCSSITALVPGSTEPSTR